MTSSRSYKAPVPLEEAISILRTQAGKQFDPNLVDIFTEQLENGKIELQFSEVEEKQLIPELSGG